MPVALRRERLALAVALGIGDLAGAFPLDRVMIELSDLADRALDAASADAIRHRVPDAEAAGFTASRSPDNIGHNSSRMTFVARHAFERARSSNAAR